MPGRHLGVGKLEIKVSQHVDHHSFDVLVREALSDAAPSAAVKGHIAVGVSFFALGCLEKRAVSVEAIWQKFVGTLPLL